ncbi:MAG: hypothetical protein F6K24_58210, partial [Okeania sp. SIO2D1]|nr:hypothetical protein [Okeania sp. SIO2D1]
MTFGIGCCNQLAKLNTADLWDWLRLMRGGLTPEKFAGVTTSRRERWWGQKVEFLSSM